MSQTDNPFDRFPALYDWEHDPFTEDLDVYLAFARRFGGPVLELACGSGRILEPLCAAGFECAGVDASAGMLARAEKRLARTGLHARLEQRRVEEMVLDGRYRTILFPLDGLGLLLDRHDQASALRNARRVVTHDGRLVVDVSNGNLRGACDPAEEVLRHVVEPHPETGRPTTKWVIRRPDSAAQVDDLTFMYDEEQLDGRLARTTIDMKLRWLTRFELEWLLEASDWVADELYGGYDLSPYGADSERLLVVARPGRGDWGLGSGIRETGIGRRDPNPSDDPGPDGGAGVVHGHDGDGD